MMVTRPGRGRWARPQLGAGRAGLTVVGGAGHDPAMADRSGPLSGIKIIELAGIGPAPYTCMMLADAGAQVLRLERAAPGAVERAADGTAAGAGPVLGPAEPVAPLGRHRPQEPRRRRAGARARGRRRRVDRGVPARRGRAAGRRARGLFRPQPAAGLRAHDRVGPGRADGAHGRPRHRLHRHRRRAVVDGPGRLGAGAAAEPGGRLRRRRHAAGLRHGGRPARGGPLGRGPGGRRRHGRRRGVPHDDDPRLPPRRHLERAARGQHARHGRALLRGLRDGGREVDGGGRHRGAVLRRAARGSRPGRRRRRCRTSSRGRTGRP